jgi:hypothetical protein
MIEVTKELLASAICGNGFHTISLAEEMTKRGFAMWTGNQHNESWAWNRRALLHLSIEDLEGLYVLSLPSATP